MIVRTNSDRFSRRALLKGLGLGAGMLPLLSTERALGQLTPAGAPKRMVVITWPNGVIKSSFFPAAPGPIGTFGATLAAMQPYAKKILMPMGLGINVATYAGHFSWGAIWTGMAKGRTGQGPSIDQTVSDNIAKKVTLPVPLMNAGVRVIGDGQPSSWRSAGVKNVWEIDPNRLFNRVFAGASTTMTSPMLDTIKLQRKSVLDFVARELDNFGKRLGVDDRSKISAHHESLRDIEKRLSAPGVGASCNKPMVAAGKLDTPTMMKTMYDLMAAALKCDVTRVATLDMYDDGGGDGNSFGNLGINRDYHAVAHGGGPDKIKIDAWLYTMVAGFVKQLEDTVEGGGTMLDNSLVVVGNGQEDGGSHKVSPIPFLLVGSAGGFFKTGRAVQCSSNQHNRLLATICNAMDIPVTGYGAADRQGVLPELSTV
jgi:Protein of unknown function (DUF1552)